MSYVRVMVVQDLDAALDERLRIACALAHKLDSELIGITAVNLLDSFGYDPIIASESMTDHRERLEARVRVAEEAFATHVKSWQLTGSWRKSLAHSPTEFVNRRITLCRFDSDRSWSKEPGRSSRSYHGRRPSGACRTFGG